MLESNPNYKHLGIKFDYNTLDEHTDAVVNFPNLMQVRSNNNELKQ